MNQIDFNHYIPNILIVDDVVENLKLLGIMLKEHGYNVRPVPNAVLALKVAQNEKPDLILLDIMMPEMDGFEVCANLKSNPLLKDVPVIFISALNDTDNIVKGLQCGGVDYITKPFQAEEVKARVATHITLYLQQQQLIAQSEELKLLNDTKDKFFSILAHDLRAPFSAFLGVSKDLSNNLMDLTYREIQEMANNLDSSANNVYKLLENLLQWAKMQRGLIDYNPENCNLKILVKQNYDLISEFALLKQIKFEIDINESLEIFVDIAMLNTVIRNVITNAIKFTNSEGKIIIKAVDYVDENDDSNSYVLCSISDSGIGMSKFILENLFKIDQNVSREGTDGESSSGLGLLLCKEFIEKNHGKMWAESIENQGSTFYFTIPKPIS